MLRYTALALGVFYGFTHQRTLTSTQKAAATKREYERKQGLINKAKEEYVRMKNPVAMGGGGMFAPSITLFVVLRPAGPHAEATDEDRG